MPYLVATSPALARWGNDLHVANAEALAEVLAAERDVEPDVAVRAESLALLAPGHAFITELGRRVAAGSTTAEAALALRPQLEAAFAVLDAGLGSAGRRVSRR